MVDSETKINEWGSLACHHGGEVKKGPIKMCGPLVAIVEAARTRRALKIMTKKCGPLVCHRRQGQEGPSRL